jgi:hypothetical protein
MRMIYLVSVTNHGIPRSTLMRNRKTACRLASMFADGTVHAMPWLSYKELAFDAPTFRTVGDCVYRTADHYAPDTVRQFA